MGVRFRKSIKIAPGVKLNINKKSCSVTVGKRGAHYTINSKGKHTASVGIPGTGLSYTNTTGGKEQQYITKKEIKEQKKQQIANNINSVTVKMYKSKSAMSFCKYFHLITGLILIILGLLLTLIIPFCIIFPILGLFSIYLSNHYSKQLKKLKNKENA